MAETTAESTTKPTTTTTTTEPPAAAAAAAPVPAPGPGLKHPLQGRWALWFDSPQAPVQQQQQAAASGRKPATRQEEWTNNLRHLIEFDTVEDFWSVWNVLIAPSKLAIGSNYHLFRNGIEPKWEDPVNAKGGKWVASFPKRPLPGTTRTIDDFWLFACLACIGEQFGDYHEEICGVVVSPRKPADRVSLWTRSGEANKDVVLDIGRRFRQALELPDTQKTGFSLHEISVKRGGSWIAPKYELPEKQPEKPAEKP